MAKRKKFTKKTPLDLAGLLALHDTVGPDFMDKWAEGTKNEGRVLAENWSDDQEKDIKKQGRQPYSMPVNASYLQRISATQKQSRQGWKVDSSVDPNDEVKARIADMQLQDFERQNDLKHIESEVFDDGINLSFGADKFDVDYSKGYPCVINKKIDYRNLVWDINDVDYSLTNTLFIAEIEKKYKFEMEAEGYDVSSGTNTTSALIGRHKNEYYSTRDKAYPDIESTPFEIVSVFHHWQRVYRDFHCVLFKDTAGLFKLEDVMVAKFESRSKAKGYIKDLKLAYHAQGLEWIDAKGEPQAEIVVKTERRYDYYKFYYNEILDYQKGELEEHPYNIYFAIRSASNWTSLMSFMSSMQLFMDRLWSQIDHSFMKELKEVLEMDTSNLADGMTKSKAITTASKTGGVIPKKGPGPLFNEVPTSGFNPQYMQTISVMTDYMSQMLGGANFQGSQESASESGRAVALRQKQGSLIASLFLDNLARYKKAKGKKLLYWLSKYDTTQRVIRVMGGELTDEEKQVLSEQDLYQPGKMDDTTGYMTINKPGVGISFLKNAQFELEVTEVPLTETQKQAKLMDAIQAEKIDPMLQASITWRMYKLDLLGINKNIREQLKKEIVANAKAQAEASKRAEDREDAKLNLDKAKVIQDSVKIKNDQKKTEAEKAEADAERELAKNNGDKKK